jgi:ABC-type dipeptide/oligopeptide/nickel transport system ATPase component
MSGVPFLKPDGVVAILRKLAFSEVRQRGRISSFAQTCGTFELATLVVTHNMELAARMDRRVTLREGRVVELDQFVVS